MYHSDVYYVNFRIPTHLALLPYVSTPFKISCDWCSVQLLHLLFALRLLILCGGVFVFAWFNHILIVHCTRNWPGQLKRPMYLCTCYTKDGHNILRGHWFRGNLGYIMPNAWHGATNIFATFFHEHGISDGLTNVVPSSITSSPSQINSECHQCKKNSNNNWVDGGV